MSTTRLTIAYEGTPFAGWARQPGERTVQAELEAALQTVLRAPVELTVAGRTDTGVHAWRQIASYEGDPPKVIAVNALLPPEIAVLTAERAPDGFDARRDAKARTYCYRVLPRRMRDPFSRRHALFWPTPLDEGALHACAAALPGTHDFTAFTPTETDHVRFRRQVFSAEWRRAGEHLEFWIEAESFLRNMNRALVGTMLQVAGGTRSLGSFEELLAGRPREAAGPTAKPHGLHLVSVRY